MQQDMIAAKCNRIWSQHYAQGYDHSTMLQDTTINWQKTFKNQYMQFDLNFLSSILCKGNDKIFLDLKEIKSWIAFFIVVFKSHSFILIH